MWHEVAMESCSLTSVLFSPFLCPSVMTQSLRGFACLPTVMGSPCKVLLCPQILFGRNQLCEGTPPNGAAESQV